jgi:hypothetical protein
LYSALQLHAQILEALVGLQVGVLLGHHHQARQRARQLALGLLELVEGLGVVQCLGRDLDRRRLGPRLDHLGQGFLLEVGFALDGGHDVRDQVGAPLVLVEYLAPARLDLLVERLELVVAAAAQHQHRGEGGKPGGDASGDGGHARVLLYQGGGCYPWRQDAGKRLGFKGRDPGPVHTMDALPCAVSSGPRIAPVPRSVATVE